MGAKSLKRKYWMSLFEEKAALPDMAVKKFCEMKNVTDNYKSIRNQEFLREKRIKMVSTGWIEENSINILKTSLSKTKLIDCSQIKEGDKTPSWDGELLYYSDESWSANNVRKISIQIKGCCQEKINNKKYYRIERKHIENYYHDGGILFFYVTFNENLSEHRIFYSSLMPADLIGMLRANENKEIKIPLSVFPEENTGEMLAIIENYILNKPKQAYLIDNETDAIQGISRINLYDELVTPIVIPRTSKNSFEYITNKDQYLYGTVNGFNREDFISIIKNIRVENVIRINVGIGEKTYFDHFCQYVEAGKTSYVIENCLRIEPEKENGESDIAITIKGSLSQQLLATEFIRNMYISKGFTVGTKFLSVNNVPKDVLKKIEDRLNKLTTVQKAMQQLGVHDDLQYDKLTNIEMKTLNALTAAVIDGEKLIFNGVKENILYGPISIGNLKINVWGVRSGNKYSIDSFNQQNNIYVFHEDDYEMKNPIPVPQSVLLEAADYAYSSNIDLKLIEQEIIKKDWEQIAYDYMVNDLMEMIKGYDLNPHDELYLLMKKICKYLLVKESYSIKMQINSLQIVKRKRNLNKKEKEQLQSLLHDDLDMTERCGILILLEDYRNAECLYDSFPDDIQEQFRSYPIFSLLQNGMSETD